MPKRVDIDELADVIREADKPLTESEIAERYEVSRPAIVNHRDDLQSYPGVRHGPVGQATAYWFMGGREADDVDTSGGPEKSLIDDDDFKPLEREAHRPDVQSETESNEITNLTIAFTAGAIAAFFIVVQSFDWWFVATHGGLISIGVVGILVGLPKRFDRAKSRSKSKIIEAGEGIRGGYRIVKEAVRDEHPGPDDPTGLVEHIAWWDLKAIKWTMIPTIVLGVSLYGAVEWLGLEGLMTTVGPSVTFWWLVLFIFGMYIWPTVTMVAALAQLSIATSEQDTQQVTPSQTI